METRTAHKRPTLRCFLFCEGVKRDGLGGDTVVRVTTSVSPSLGTNYAGDGTAATLEQAVYLLVDCEPGHHTVEISFLGPASEKLFGGGSVSIALRAEETLLRWAPRLPMELRDTGTGEHRTEVRVDDELVASVPFNVFFFPPLTRAAEKK